MSIDRRLAGLPIDPLKPPTCPDCGGETHPGDDQFADAWICGACLKVVSSNESCALHRLIEETKRQAVEEFKDQNQTACDCCQNMFIGLGDYAPTWHEPGSEDEMLCAVCLAGQMKIEVGKLQDEREENYRLRLKIQELEDNLASVAANEEMLLTALENVETSIGDRLLSRGPLSKEYARAVLTEINQAIAKATKAVVRRVGQTE